MPNRISVVDVVDKTGTRAPPARARSVPTHQRRSPVAGRELGVSSRGASQSDDQRTATDALAFVIADQPGTLTLPNVYPGGFVTTQVPSRLDPAAA
jgi:hypothetical protein